jgi:hypothetical protein
MWCVEVMQAERLVASCVASAVIMCGVTLVEMLEEFACRERM